MAVGWGQSLSRYVSCHLTPRTTLRTLRRLGTGSEVPCEGRVTDVTLSVAGGPVGGPGHGWVVRGTQAAVSTLGRCWASGWLRGPLWGLHEPSSLTHILLERGRTGMERGCRTSLLRGSVPAVLLGASLSRLLTETRPLPLPHEPRSGLCGRPAWPPTP